MGPLVRRQLAPAVDIDYVDPLPKRFDLVLRARAYGNNVGEPISVRVGDEERFVSLGEQDSTVTLRFDNPRGAQKISITRRRRPSRKRAPAAALRRRSWASARCR